MNSDTLTISTSMPVSVSPTGSEIVYNPESNSYALSISVNVQLPITELVELLLKFNQEHVALPAACEQVEPIASSSRLASLPVATSFSPVHAPAPDAVYTPERRGKFEDDEFMRIPIAVTRQDPFLMDYRERSKWTTGKFLASSLRENETLNRLTLGFQQYDQLPVNPHFANQEWVEYVPAASPWSGAKLSADAPVFTPGSGFSTQASSCEFSRERRMSEAVLPPSAMEAKADSMSDPLQSIWNNATRDVTPDAWTPVPASSPGECKQM